MTLRIVRTDPEDTLREQLAEARAALARAKRSAEKASADLFDAESRVRSLTAQLDPDYVARLFAGFKKGEPK